MSVKDVIEKHERPAGVQMLSLTSSSVTKVKNSDVLSLKVYQIVIWEVDNDSTKATLELTVFKQDIQGLKNLSELGIGTNTEL